MGWVGGVGWWGGFLVITVSHPTFCCVGVGLWLRLGLGCDKKLTQNLPDGINDLDMLSFMKNSIGNKWDLKEISEITFIKVLMNYINTKYLGSPSLHNDSLKPIREAKDPCCMKISISNIQNYLNLYSRLKSVKLDSKIETQCLALFKQKCLLEERRAKYYEAQVQDLCEAMDDLDQPKEIGSEVIIRQQ